MVSLQEPGASARSDSWCITARQSTTFGAPRSSLARAVWRWREVYAEHRAPRRQKCDQRWQRRLPDANQGARRVVTKWARSVGAPSRSEVS